MAARAARYGSSRERSPRHPPTAAPPPAARASGSPSTDQGPGIAARASAAADRALLPRRGAAALGASAAPASGLAIVKHILRRHQGHLAIDSTPGAGSTLRGPAADGVPSGDAVTELSSNTHKSRAERGDASATGPYPLSWRHHEPSAHDRGCDRARGRSPPQAQARDQIRIVGSSTVFPFSTAVAEQFGTEVGHEDPGGREHRHRRRHQAVLRRRRRGHARHHQRLAPRSRRPRSRPAPRPASTEITEVQIGFDGIVLANSKQHAPLSTSPSSEIWLALAKEVPVDGKLVANPYKTWNEIDPSLPAEKIEVLGPPPTSGTRDAFVELVHGRGLRRVPRDRGAGRRTPRRPPARPCARTAPTSRPARTTT